MRSVVELAARPGFTVSAVTCRDDHARWSPVEAPLGHRMVLVRSGRFRRRSAHGPADLDPTLAYVGLPGEEEHFAHPSGGDVCTSVSVDAGTWAVVTGGAERLARSTVYVDAHVELTHRRVLAAARGGDLDYALVEQLLALLATAVRQLVTASTPVAAPGSAGDAALVAAAREAIGCGHPAAARLFSLAELLAVSPYRLSRAFPRELGVSLTRYRNRVRVARALERLEHGEGGLAQIAADLEFADQAHLTRTVREHLGHTPTALRRVLRGGAATV
ncbi:helix-turn-helix transcriptional regulator [Pseudonocardia nigra]|uniref:helix-turn-helix transcriptional regulator n=1 Tax=Pseudonocardia nigra TaxID=1921578 RepID=UPI0027E2E0F5|nr:helix-turn-helix transcriptional regulator [Pseudonocardia nigra]